jgi:hypothetical protein
MSAVEVAERPRLHGRWCIQKFRDGRQYAEIVADNCPLNLGIAELLDLGFGLGGTAFSNGNARIGVGDGTTVADPTQTGLVGSTKHYEAMDSGFPARANQTVTVRATLAAGHGTQTVSEVVLDNGTTALSRLVSALGVKAASDVWIITGTFSLH